MIRILASTFSVTKKVLIVLSSGILSKLYVNRASMPGVQFQQAQVTLAFLFCDGVFSPFTALVLSFIHPSNLSHCVPEVTPLNQLLFNEQMALPGLL